MKRIDDIEFLLFEYAEGQLSDGQKEEVEKLIAGNSYLQEELELFQLATLEQEEIVFENKESLKQKAAIIPLWIGGIGLVKMATAAAILIVSGVVFYNVIPSDNLKSELTESFHSRSEPKQIATISEPKQEIADATITENSYKETEQIISITSNKNQKSSKARYDRTASEKLAIQNKLEGPKNKLFVSVSKRDIKLNTSSFNTEMPSLIQTRTVTSDLDILEDIHWSKQLKKGALANVSKGIRTLFSTKIKVRNESEQGPVLVVSAANYEVLAQLNRKK